MHQCDAGTDLHISSYDANGKLSADSTYVVLGTTADVRLATLTNGNVAMQWWTMTPTPPRTLTEMHVQVIAPTALPTSLDSATAVPLQPGRTPLGVQSLADGGFLVPWSALSPYEAKVPVSRYSSQGAPL